MEKLKCSFPTSCKQSYPQFHDTVSYTHYAQCRLLRNPNHFFTEQDLLLQKEIIGWNGDKGTCIEHSGKVEETDFNLEETALRETHEEVGVHPDKVKIIKTFSEIYIPPSNFLVAPFMGISHEELMFIPDLDEVKRVLEFSIVDFLDEKSITKVKMSTSYATDIEVPAFIVDKYIVWGATAMMMSELKETIKSVLR